MVERAGPDDAHEAMSLLREVAAYRASIGQVRWPLDWFTQQNAERWISADELVVARKGGQIVGVMLFESVDQRFWPDYPDGEAYFVHRLARRRGGDVPGGLAGPMLDWAHAETRRLGRPWLRLDCAPEARLCAIYERAGFERVDLKEVEPDFWSVRWQKPA